MFRTLFVAAFAALTLVSIAFAQESISVNTDAGQYQLDSDGLVVRMDTTTPAYAWEDAPQHVRAAIIDATLGRELRSNAVAANAGSKNPIDVSAVVFKAPYWGTMKGFQKVFHVAKTHKENTF